MANIRSPEFGVKKDELTLTTQDPNAVLYGVTPDNKFIPVQIDDAGKLQIGSVALDVSDMQIGAIEIKNHDTDDRVEVTTAHELVAESRLHDGTGTDLTSTLVGVKQGLDVNVVGGSALSVSEDEDGDVPANQSSVGLLINLNYGYDGVSWKRINATSNALHVDVQSSVLPTGAATESSLSGFRTDFNAVDFATETTLAGIKAQTDLLTFDVSDRLAIQDQPSFDVLLSTRASEATLSSVDTKLTDASQKTQIVDGAGNVIGSTSNALDVNVKSGVTLDVNLDNANDNVLVYGQDSGAVNRPLRTNTSGQLEISVISSVLPTGAATEATLSSLNGKVTTVDTDDIQQSTHDNLNANANIQVGDVDVSGANPVPTDLTDDVTREVGRVLSSDKTHTSESYATTDTLSNARPTNGDLDVQHYKTKNVVVKNVDVANDAEIEILGSVDGSLLDVVIVPLFTLKPGEISTTSEERAFTHIRINARSKTAGNSADIETKGYSLGV